MGWEFNNIEMLKQGDVGANKGIITQITQI
jgi:hypothetical protein